MNITIEEIKEMYGKHVVGDEDALQENKMCVGGAILKYCYRFAEQKVSYEESRAPFPSPQGLGWVMARLSEMTEKESRSIAEKVTQANDKGKIDKAWKHAAKWFV